VQKLHPPRLPRGAPKHVSLSSSHDLTWPGRRSL
jgi:hypothetical protein